MGPFFAANIRKAISAMKKKKIRFAGLVADSIFSSDGIYPGEPGFMAEAIDECSKSGWRVHRRRGAARVRPHGREDVGFERHGVVPDMVVMGKPMGNGYPIGGVTVKPDLLETFGETAGYFNTFGGNPVAAAAGLAVLETIEAEALQQNALEIGAYLWRSWRPSPNASSQVGDVRGKGLTSASSSCATASRRSRRGPPPPASWKCSATAISWSASPAPWQHPQDPPAAASSGAMPTLSSRRFVTFSRTSSKIRSSRVARQRPDKTDYRGCGAACRQARSKSRRSISC